MTSERVISATFPVTLAFTPDGRFFYNELLSGRIRVYDLGWTCAFAQVNVVRCGGFGLLGLAIDTEFEENRYICVYFIGPVADREYVGHPVIVRFTDVDGKGQYPTIIVGDLPNTSEVCAYVGGNLHFVPDGYLYVSIRNMQIWEPNYALDLGSLRGKILRIDKGDGSAASSSAFVEDPQARSRALPTDSGIPSISPSTSRAAGSTLPITCLAAATSAISPRPETTPATLHRTGRRQAH